MSTLIYLLIILFTLTLGVQAQEFGGPATTPLLMIGNKVLSPTSIRFHIQDISDSETGYVIHDTEERVLASSGPNPFPAWLEARNLKPDTYYCAIHAHVVKGSALSPPSEEFPCAYTFAIRPVVPAVLKIGAGSVTLALKDPGNPVYTKYRIEEVRRGLWVNSTGNLIANPVSKTIAEWGGDNGILIVGLGIGTYEFRAYAKNGDGFLTDPSSATSVIIEIASGVPDALPEPKTPLPTIEEMEFQPPQIFGPLPTYPSISPTPGVDLDKPISAPTSTPETISTSTKEAAETILLTTSTPSATITTKQSITKVLSVVGKNLNDLRKLTIDNPEVERLNQTVVVPTLKGTVTITSAATLTLPNLFPYLRYLLSQPLLLFWRRKRQNWGVIYNAITKLPLDLAIVRLLEARTGRIVQTRVTDRAGRYIFFGQPGKYRLEVTKKQYIFPTTILKNKKDDLRYLDLYNGEVIDVSAKQTTISKNIPLDPSIKRASKSRLIFEKFSREAQYIGATSSMIAALVSLAIDPTGLALFLVVAQAIILAFFARLARGAKPKDLGRVMDAKTKKGLALAIVRVFDNDYNKLLETALTDLRGRYTFLVGENIYYVQAEKAGYKSKQTLPINFGKKSGVDEITENIMLERQNNS